MKTLVLVEHEGGQLKDATLSAVTAASKLGEVHLLVAGEGVGGVAEAAAKIAGAGKVHVADGAHLEHQLAEDVAPIVAALMADHDAFLASSTTTGKNIAPRVAALLDVMQISDILSVDGDDTFTRPIYAGNAIATVKSSDAKKVITVRGTAFEKAARDGGSGSIEAIDAGADPVDGKAVVAKMKELPTDDPLFGKGSVRADGRKIHPAYLFEVKKPSESKGPWDYYKIRATIPADQAFRPLKDGDCRSSNDEPRRERHSFAVKDLSVSQFQRLDFRFE